MMRICLVSSYAKYHKEKNSNKNASMECFFFIKQQEKMQKILDQKENKHNKGKQWCRKTRIMNLNNKQVG